MQYEALKIFSATIIQRHFRGYIDRDLYRRKKFKHWYDTIYIPSILKVQACSRMHRAKVAYKLLIKSNLAAKTIQRVYKRMKEKAARRERFREVIRLKRIKNATIISKYVRRWLHVKAYKVTMLARAGKRILAGKVIMRAWRNFVYGKRLQILLDEYRLKLLKEKSLKLKLSREEILLDIKEIKNDIEFLEKAINRMKKRLKEVDTFLLEANMRIPKLQMDLATISNEDMERGWAEAYGQEYESLNHMASMATIEKRMLKHSLMNKNREMLFLQCELEDTEWEADNIGVLELENMEALRRSEVGRVERRVIDKKNRALRTERCKWKIDSIRKNVIARNRLNFMSLLKEVLINILLI